MFRYITIVLLGMLMFCMSSNEGWGQNRMRLQFDNPSVIDQGSLGGYHYRIMLRAEVNSSWLVRTSYVIISYNSAALRVTAESLSDLDVTLAASGYTAKIIDYPGSGTFTVELKEPDSRNFVTKSSAVFNIGLLRFEVLNGNLMDNLQYVVSGTYATRIHHGEGFGTPPSDWQELNYDCGNATCYTVINPTPRIIFTPACQNQFYKLSQCNREALASTTNNPLGEGYMRWPRQASSGGNTAHMAYYRYDLQNNAPTGNHARNFAAGQLESMMDWGRCRWQKQCGDELQWGVTVTGGRMWWGTTVDDMLSLFNAQNALAVTCLAVRENEHQYIVASSTCGCPKHGMSEIVFNNTDLYFNTNPNTRWTTDYTQCGGNTNCADFRSVSVHELGHYIGLPHNWRAPDLMNEYGYVGPQLTFYACDADRARMLYNPALVGTTPDNGSGCPTTDVEEQPQRDVVDLNVLVYPVPVYTGEFTVRYSLQQTGIVSVMLLDLFGNVVQTFASGLQETGEHNLLCRVDNVSSGVYYLKVEAQGVYRVQKIVVRK